MFKTLIFDLGQVIVPFDFKRGYAKMEPLCAYPAAEIPDRLRNSNLVVRFETGQIEARQFAQELSSILQLNTDYAGVCEILNSIFFPQPLIPDAFLASLKERYRLLLLSNTNSIHFEMIEQHYPLLRHFDRFILSYQVGAVKPSPAIFEAALAEAHCRPDECFFTDDIAAYVEAARRHGIDAVQFQSFEQLQSELMSRGILKSPEPSNAILDL